MLPFRNDEEQPMQTPQGFGGFQSLAPIASQMANQFGMQLQRPQMQQAQPVARMNPMFNQGQRPQPGLFGRNRRLGMRG